MSNTIAASPNVLAEQVLAGLRGRLAVLSAVSTNLTPTATGKTMQVSLVSGGAAKEYSKANGGYHEADDADISAATVTLKHLHSTKAFSPDEISEYGEAYMVNAFVPEAINALVKKVHAEMAALVLNANYSANEVITAANFNYSQVVDLNTDLNAAKAGDPRALILSSAYAGAIRKDATLTSGAFNGVGASGPLVATGTIGQVVGFNIFEFTDLPTNSENLGGFALVLRHQRAMIHTLGVGDPFHPRNVSRLKQIGWTLAIVTGGSWIGQNAVSHLVRGALEPPGLFDLVTPTFAVLIVFVLAGVFREGARLRRESELTI